jgi:hypothetical protein
VIVPVIRTWATVNGRGRYDRCPERRRLRNTQRVSADPTQRSARAQRDETLKTGVQFRRRAGCDCRGAPHPPSPRAQEPAPDVLVDCTDDL